MQLCRCDPCVRSHWRTQHPALKGMWVLKGTLRGDYLAGPLLSLDTWCKCLFASVKRHSFAKAASAAQRAVPQPFPEEGDQIGGFERLAWTTATAAPPTLPCSHFASFASGCECSRSWLDLCFLTCALQACQITKKWSCAPVGKKPEYWIKEL